MAPASNLVQRLTTFTALRTIRCTFPNRVNLARSSNCLYSTRNRRTPQTETRNTESQGPAVSLIKDLLTGQESKPAKLPQTPKQSEASSQSLHAEFVADIRKYEPAERTTERWRRRSTTASSVRHDDSKLGTVRGLPRAGEEIVFKAHHHSLLEVPYQDKSYKEQRRLEYINFNAMRSFVQVLTTPTADTPGTTLLLHFDNKRYLIGSLAEGTQRASVQMGARLLKVSECFVTGRTEWKNTGGLIGMILTLADAAASSQAASRDEMIQRARAKGKRLGVLDDREKMRELEEEAKRDLKNSTLTLFGPPNLNHTLATARRFVFRKGMPVNVHEIQDDRSSRQEGEDEWAPYYADENIKVWAMSISPTSPRRPSTPRKRSIDEVYERTSITNGTAEDELTAKDRDQLTVKAVVSEMFNSSWRLDTLYETPLCEVKLPAAIFIRNPETNKIERYKGPLPGGDKPLQDPNLTVLVRKPWPGALIENLPKTEPAREAISYIIRNHTIRGKFKPEAATRLKVEKGYKWAQLTSRNSVLNEDGETITPDMVLGPSKEGGGIAVVNLPEPSYINGLISRPEWREPKVMAGVGAVVWICGEGVAIDPRVQGFMKQLGNLKHVVSSPEYCPNEISLDSVMASTVRLRKVDPARYMIPVHGAPLAIDSHKNRASIVLPHNAHLAARGQVVQLEPNFELQNGQVIPPLDIVAVEEETSQEVLDEAIKAQQAIEADLQQEFTWASTIPDKDAEIITLGTGSALPSKYRNVSATLLQVPGWGSMLFDCGENTLGQLKRVFTAEELRLVLQDLRLIFISHMHADHHLGTVGVIKAWYQEVHNSQPAPPPSSETPVQRLLKPDQKRLTIISEPAMMHWLTEYSSIEDYGFSHLAPLHCTNAVPYQNIPSKLAWFVPPSDLAPLSKESRIDSFNRNIIPPSLLGLSDVQTVAVNHCHGARAISITWPSGFKASYSGDCRPSKAFTQIGKGSTVVIHEATFDDELQADAEAKQHCTTSEALGVAQGMGAKACVLTHFSQRYQKLPVLEHANGNVGEEGREVLENEGESRMEEGEKTNPEVTFDGLMEDDTAATFPDQVTSNWNAARGRQYDMAGNKNTDNPFKGSGPPSAVKFKLASDMKVCVAFDYMRVKVGEMAQMEKFTPALLKLFAEEDKVEDKTEAVEADADGKKRKQKKQQQNKQREKHNESQNKATKRVSVDGDGT